MARSGSSPPAGFTVDCLGNTRRIGYESAELFKSGGEAHACRCLNDHRLIGAMKQVC
jgi:protoheme ferro-lyase